MGLRLETSIGRMMMDYIDWVASSVLVGSITFCAIMCFLTRKREELSPAHIDSQPGDDYKRIYRQFERSAEIYEAERRVKVNECLYNMKVRAKARQKATRGMRLYPARP